MEHSRGYVMVDVFGQRPLSGNPVAVVLDAEGLDIEAMQEIARWTNLSETTFVLRPTMPEADYRLRIFTPRGELPFAGHPTLGSAHAFLEAGRTLHRRDRLTQQCGVGLVDVTFDGGADDRRLTFSLPSAHMAFLTDADIAELESILGQKSHEVAPAIVDVGPTWIIVPLIDATAVLELQPDLARLAVLERRLGVTGLTVFGRYRGGEVAIEVRSFAPSCGVDEDPVCGSGNASVAAFAWNRGLLPPGGVRYVAAQGSRIGRDGRIHVQVDADGQIRVGGTCVTCVRGVIAF
jgi:PhzF family phenazine biosynthesis protein